MEAAGTGQREVARKLGYRNATRVGEYLQQRIVAGPDMLARLAVAVNVSPIDALWNARHYPTVLEYLNKLSRFGASWAYKDRVDIDSQGASFALPYSEIDFPPDGDLRIPPPNLAHRYHTATVYNRAGIFRIISLPKPMACADPAGSSAPAAFPFPNPSSAMFRRTTVGSSFRARFSD